MSTLLTIGLGYYNVNSTAKNKGENNNSVGLKFWSKHCYEIVLVKTAFLFFT